MSPTLVHKYAYAHTHRRRRSHTDTGDVHTHTHTVLSLTHMFTHTYTDVHTHTHTHTHTHKLAYRHTYPTHTHSHTSQFIQHLLQACRAKTQTTSFPFYKQIIASNGHSCPISLDYCHNYLQQVGIHNYKNKPAYIPFINVYIHVLKMLVKWTIGMQKSLIIDQLASRCLDTDRWELNTHTQPTLLQLTHIPYQCVYDYTTEILLVMNTHTNLLFLQLKMTANICRF